MNQQHERHIESCPRCKAPVQLLWRTRTGDYEFFVLWEIAQGSGTKAAKTSKVFREMEARTARFFVGCHVCGARTGMYATGREAWREWDALCKGTEHGASRR